MVDAIRKHFLNLKKINNKFTKEEVINELNKFG
jgi:hypothetical protein